MTVLSEMININATVNKCEGMLKDKQLHRKYK